MLPHHRHTNASDPPLRKAANQLNDICLGQVLSHPVIARGKRRPHILTTAIPCSLVKEQIAPQDHAKRATEFIRPRNVVKGTKRLIFRFKAIILRVFAQLPGDRKSQHIERIRGRRRGQLGDGLPSLLEQHTEKE